ncbi:hypothetical protein [Haliangium sp.]|uniref:hypothetical protein n=1 Tax=Haliangium sp. TaxID=2663208 RepID=UPI003D0C3D08
MAHQMFTNTYHEIVYNSREEGREQGLTQSRKADGERLIRLLRTRFGRVPRAVQARIKAAGTTELDGWYERLLVAESVAEVMGDET